MKYLTEDSQLIHAKCEGCGRILKLDKKYIKFKKRSSAVLIAPVDCFCDISSDIILEIPVEQSNITSNQEILHSIIQEEENIAHCPNCGSNQLVAGTEGFKTGNAILGAVLFGPMGLLGGHVGSNAVVVTCIKCGYKWKP